MSYNSIYTSVQDMEESVRKLRRASSIFCSGINLGDTPWTTGTHPLVQPSGFCAVSGVEATASQAADGFLIMHNPAACSFLYIGAYISPFLMQVNCDGMIELEYFETLSNNCSKATFNGCNNLSTVDIEPSVAVDGMDAPALNNLYTSLPNRANRVAGTLYLNGNVGTGSHNPTIATKKNWIFG